MNYTEVTISCAQEAKEILSAELGELQVEAIQETDEGLKAYFPEADFFEQDITELRNRYQETFPFKFSIDVIERQNWNAVWESNFRPVEVKSCRIRATFHQPDPAFEHDIVIEPKMSFGTGHHATTALMVASILDLDFTNKAVLDCGYGTGILAILAMKLGARRVEGVETDSWCVENANENQHLNEISKIAFHHGDIATVTLPERFDVILANINKNVLLQEMVRYAEKLNAGGTLLLSGFYEQDLNDIREEGARQGLQFEGSKSESGWIAAQFLKIEAY